MLILYHILIVEIIRIGSWFILNNNPQVITWKYTDSIYKQKYRLGLDYVKKSNKTLYLNICVNLHKKSIKLLEDYKIDIVSYMRTIFKQTSQIWISHNFQVNIREMTFLNQSSNLNAPSEDNIDYYRIKFRQVQATCNVIILFTDMKELKSRGVAYLDKICSLYSFGLVDISAGLRFLTNYVAKNLAHELAHILGGEHIFNQLIVKPHYVIGNCSCHHLDEEYCVLGEYQLETTKSTPPYIDECNMEVIIRKSKNKPCLKQSYPRLYGQCGDGVIDLDEECDCGYKELCSKIYSIKDCCNITNCRFNQWANCSIENCCSNCTFAGNLICRQQKSDCDIPEYCKDEKLECPPDKYKPDYTRCYSNNGYCYNGKCVNVDIFCQMTYGANESYFSHSCAKFVQNTIFQTCTDLVKKVDVDFIQDLCYSSGSFCNFFVCGVIKNYSSNESHIFQADKDMCIYPIYTNGQHSLSNNLHFKPCFDNSSSQKRLCNENKCIVQSILKDICQNISKLDNFVNGLELELKFELKALDEMKSNLEYPEYFSAAKQNNFKYTMLKFVSLFVLSSIINFLVVKIFYKIKSFMGRIFI